MANKVANSLPPDTQKRIMQQLFFSNNANIDVIKRILESLPNRWNEYPEILAWAIIGQKLDTVQFLLQEGVPLEYPPLSLTQGGSQDPEINAILQASRRTPYIVLAGCSGSIEIIQLLLNSGRTLKEIGQIGFSRLKSNSVIGNVLTAAIFYDKLDTVDWLLSNHSKEELGLEDQITEQKSKSGRGSFPKEYSGCTPFLISIYKSSPEVIQLLIRSGAQVNAQDFQGNGALHIATTTDRPEIVRLLLDTQGIDIYARNKKGQNALTIAKEKGLQTIDTILSNNIDDSSQRIAQELIDSVLSEEEVKKPNRRRRRGNKQEPKKPEEVKVEAREPSPPPPPPQIVVLPDKPTKPKQEAVKEETVVTVESKQQESKGLNKAQRRALARLNYKKQNPQKVETKEVEEVVVEEEVQQPQRRIEEVVGAPPELLNRINKKRKKKKKGKQQEPQQPVQPEPVPEPVKELTPEEKLRQSERQARREVFKMERVVDELQEELEQLKANNQTLQQRIDKLEGKFDYSSLESEEIEEIYQSLQNGLKALEGYRNSQ